MENLEDKTRDAEGKVDFSGIYQVYGGRKIALKGESEEDKMKYLTAGERNATVLRVRNVETCKKMSHIKVGECRISLKLPDGSEKYVPGVVLMHNEDEDGIYAVGENESNEVMLKLVDTKKIGAIE